MKNKKGLAFLFASASILCITTADGIRGVPPQSTRPYYYGTMVKPSLKRIKDLEKRIKEIKKRCNRATLLPKKECYAELAKLKRQLMALKSYSYSPERR